MNLIYKLKWKICLYINKKLEKLYDLVICKVVNIIFKEVYDKIFLVLVVKREGILEIIMRFFERVSRLG